MALTIKDIASMAGVSKGTVSRVINNNPEGVSEETREKILKLIDEVGYVPNKMARSITVAETKTIGLIIPDVQNPFFPQVIRGVEDCAMENGYTVFLCNSDSDIKKEQKYLYTFLEKRVDGIIINTSGDLNDKKLTALIHKSNIPIVILDRKIKELSRYPGVYVDNARAAREGVSYLIENGASNIAYIAGVKDVYTVEERLKGYCMALEDAGIIINKGYLSYGGYNIHSGYERTREMLTDNPEIDGIFAGCDTIAIGVLKALRELNKKVPEDIQLLGFDNITMSGEMVPPITTVSQPMYDMGYQAARMLLASIQDKTIHQADQYLETDLMIRESTRKKQVREEI